MVIKFNILKWILQRHEHKGSCAHWLYLPHIVPFLKLWPVLFCVCILCMYSRNDIQMPVEMENEADSEDLQGGSATPAF